MSGISALGGVGGQRPMPQLSEREYKRLEESASDFEAIFLKQMLSSMRKTVPRDQGGQETLLRESEGEKIFRDMLDGEYAKIMSRTGRGIGLKGYIMRQYAPNGPVSTPAVPGNIKNIPKSQ